MHKVITQRELTSALSLLAIHLNHVSVFCLLQQITVSPSDDHNKVSPCLHNALTSAARQAGFHLKGNVSSYTKNCCPGKNFSRVVLTQLDQLHTYMGGMTDMNQIIKVKPINSRPLIPELKNIVTSHLTTIKKETLGDPKAIRDPARVIQPKP